MAGILLTFQSGSSQLFSQAIFMANKNKLGIVRIALFWRVRRNLIRDVCKWR
jgi:hypothetical protein